jgi:hypothetical protein
MKNTDQKISADQLRELVIVIYDQGPVVVKQAYSDLDLPARTFVDATALLEDLQFESGSFGRLRTYSIYYPEAKGYTYEERRRLKPEICDGHTYRFSQEGWGLIRMQCGFSIGDLISCRISVNRFTQVSRVASSYPELGDPERWDWNVLKIKANRLMHLLWKLGRRIRRHRPPHS